MTIRSGFFNSVNGDRKYDAKRFAEYFSSFIGNGVLPEPFDGLQVMSNNNMNVTVKAGKAWINGYILINDDNHILTIEPADGVLNRIDRVVLRYDVVDREIRIEVKKGVSASNPLAPTLQRDLDAYELGIADVTVSAGAISIAQGNISDLRFNTDYCGRVSAVLQTDIPQGLITMWSGLVENIPTGWVLCNGKNGTPDLTDRFIMGATIDAMINKTGGQNQVTLSVDQIPSHNHTGSTISAGSHNHGVLSTGSGQGGSPSSGGSEVDEIFTDTAGAHTHIVTIGKTGGGQAHENRPAFYTLAFIMKV